MEKENSMVYHFSSVSIIMTHTRKKQTGYQPADEQMEKTSYRDAMADLKVIKTSQGMNGPTDFPIHGTEIYEKCNNTNVHKFSSCVIVCIRNHVPLTISAFNNFLHFQLRKEGHLCEGNPKSSGWLFEMDFSMVSVSCKSPWKTC